MIFHSRIRGVIDLCKEEEEGEDSDAIIVGSIGYHHAITQYQHRQKKEQRRRKREKKR